MQFAPDYTYNYMCQLHIGGFYVDLHLALFKLRMINLTTPCSTAYIHPTGGS